MRPGLFDVSLEQAVRALDQSSHRHKVIASNIANRNTPGYRAMQAKFQDVMEEARSRIRPCIQGALRRNRNLSEIRLAVIVNPRGDMTELNVEPQEDILSSCLTLSLAQSPLWLTTRSR